MKLAVLWGNLLLLIVTGSLSAQEIFITNSAGEALTGVVVYTDGFGFSATSDIDGKVLLTTEVTFPIYFQYLGYKNVALSQKEIEENQYIVTLKVEKTVLDEVVLIGRTDIAQKDLAYESVSIERAEIQLTNSQTAADVLTASADVYVQKSQMGGGSPVIRGFEANKLLLVVDGVRMNNAIFRGGHLQNAITIDPAILENMEVIFGAGSLMYGSDALGGVVHFQSKELLLNPSTINTLSGSYYMRYGSGNQEKSGHVDFEIYGKKWASMTSISYSDYGDLRIGENRAKKYDNSYGLQQFIVVQGNHEMEDEMITPKKPYVLSPTGYNQIDILQKIKFQPSEDLSFVWNNQYSSSSNIPRYDALTELRNGMPRYAVWNYGPQQRFLSSLTTKYVPKQSSWYDRIQWIVAYQNVKEIRINRKYQAEITKIQDESLDIFNTTLDVSRVRGAHQWFAGIDGNLNRLNSTAFESRYIGNEMVEEEAGLTRYPNGNNFTRSSGVYLQYYHIPEGKKYKVNTGLRYDYNLVSSQFEEDGIFQWPDFFYEGIKNINHSVNWSTGLHYQLTPSFKLRALAGSSFRAPNIDDLAKIRLKKDEISIPNADLRPEKSLNGEISLSYQTKVTAISATGFYTYLSDAIVRQDYRLPDRNTSYVSDQDTYNIVANQNVNNAQIAGLSLNARQSIREYWTVKASISFIKGDILKEGKAVGPLSHVPPTYGRVNLQYKREKWSMMTGVRYNGTKNINRFGGSTDNPEFATKDGSLSWYTWHLSAHYKINEAFQFQLGIDNILDQFYVPFASGIPGMGRHVSATVRGKL